MKDQKVRIHTHSQTAFPVMEFQSVCHIQRHNGNGFFPWNIFFDDHVPQFGQHGLFIADANTYRISFFIKDRHAAAAIGTHRDVFERHAGSQGLTNGLGWFYTDFRARVIGIDARRDIQKATVFAPFNTLLKERSIAVGMSRKELTARNFPFSGNIKEVLNAPFAIAQMHIDDAGLAADHAADSGFCR